MEVMVCAGGRGAAQHNKQPPYCLFTAMRLDEAASFSSSCRKRKRDFEGYDNRAVRTSRADEEDKFAVR